MWPFDLLYLSPPSAIQRPSLPKSPSKSVGRCKINLSNANFAHWRVRRNYNHDQTCSDLHCRNSASKSSRAQLSKQSRYTWSSCRPDHFGMCDVQPGWALMQSLKAFCIYFPPLSRTFEDFLPSNLNQVLDSFVMVTNPPGIVRRTQKVCRDHGQYDQTFLDRRYVCGIRSIEPTQGQSFYGGIDLKACGKQ